MDKWTIVILGITGDLSKRKILPALYALFEQGNPIGLIMGTGREDVTVDAICERARPFIKDFKEDVWRRFKELLAYTIVDFAKLEHFGILEERLRHAQKEKGLQEKPRLFYLATAADYFCSITEQLVAVGALMPHDMAYRIVYEKPFGWDLQSAMSINACIQRTLSEKQVYRIDHYLARGLVSSIVPLRYANTLFKAIWNNTFVDAVKICFYESIGIEGRGEFFDRYGVLKDVVQNHVLQILSLVAMDMPASVSPEAIRDKKADVLRSINVVDGILGQYEGYQKEQGVKQESKTETYAALKLFIDHPLWHGVPFYIESGKALNHKTTEVRIMLKAIAYCPWSTQGMCEPNVLTIRIMPQEEVSLQLNIKKPGTQNELSTIDLASVFGPKSPEAYEILLKEIMNGQHTISVRFDEIEYQWSIIERIKSMNLPLFTYKQGSCGPKEACKLMHERNL